MQVMLDGRRFPPSEASNKKLAKKDAAAKTLQILSREMEGTASVQDDEQHLVLMPAEINDNAEDFFVSLWMILMLLNRYVRAEPSVTGRKLMLGQILYITCS